MKLTPVETATYASPEDSSPSMTSGGKTAATDSRVRGHRAARQFFGTWEGALGSVLMLCVLAVIIFGPSLAHYPPNESGTGGIYDGPSAAHWLGTDSLGRDVFSRLLAGGRQVLLLPLLATVTGYAVAGTIAIYVTLRGGALRRLLASFFDILLVFPPMLIALIVVGAVGPSTELLTMLLTLVILPRAGRVALGLSEGVTRKEYIAAAVGRAEKLSYIVWREILPNVWLPFTADFGVRLTGSIVFVSSLSFLGFGTQPPTPDWGRMVADSFGAVAIAPLASLAPALAVALAAVAASLMAEGLGLVAGTSGLRQGNRKKKGL